jgi:hypothetical protein
MDDVIRASQRAQGLRSQHAVGIGNQADSQTKAMNTLSSY